VSNLLTTKRSRPRFSSVIAGLAVLAVSACEPRQYTLDEVPITGATEKQRETIRKAALWFDEAAGPGRLRLNQIEVNPDIPLHASAAYRTMSERVELDSDLNGSDLFEAAIHEFCHGLDDDLGRPSKSSDVLAAAAASPELDHHFASVTRIREPAELFAQICETGPVGTSWLAHPCPGDRTYLRDAAQVVNDLVWRASPDVHLRDDDVASIHAVPLDSEVIVLSAWGIEEQPLVFMLPWPWPFHDARELAGPHGYIAVDVSSNTMAPSPGIAPDQTVHSDLPGNTMAKPYNLRPVPRKDGGAVPGVMVDEAQVMLMEYRRKRYGLQPRPMAFVDDEWHEIGGACANDTSAVAHAAGSFYVFTARSGDLSWAELSFP